MTPLHGIACFYDFGFGARAVSRKTPIYFMLGYDFGFPDHFYLTPVYKHFWEHFLIVFVYVEVDKGYKRNVAFCFTTFRHISSHLSLKWSFSFTAFTKTRGFRLKIWLKKNSSVYKNQRDKCVTAINSLFSCHFVRELFYLFKLGFSFSKIKG